MVEKNIKSEVYETAKREMEGKINPYEMAVLEFEKSADLLGLDENTKVWLLSPNKELIVHPRIRMDDGHMKEFTGYRVQHNNARGPYKGGIRFHQEVTLDLVKYLATEMTWKCSIMDVAFGGGKGAVQCNPKELSKVELERLARRYFTDISDIVGPDKDVPAPDVNTNAQVMAWMADTWSMHNGGVHAPAIITGKPIELGGIRGRNEATARGCVYAIEKAAKEESIDMDEAEVVVQGYGNAGSIAAMLLQEEGCKVIGVSDSRGGIYDSQGLNTKDIFDHKKKTQSVVGYKNLKTLSNEELLELECDILVPAALENQITEKNAKNIRAKIIAEAANGPITPKADGILYEEDIKVIPGILANGGGVYVSSLEWNNNKQGAKWKKRDEEKGVNSYLKAQMEDSYDAVSDASREYDVNLRAAAGAVAIDRVMKTSILRGLYP